MCVIFRFREKIRLLSKLFEDSVCLYAVSYYYAVIRFDLLGF